MDLSELNLSNVYSATFYNCENLTSIKLPKMLTGLSRHYGSEYGTFTNCTKLTSIELPKSLETIDLMAFWNCTGLTSICVPDNVTHIWDAFQGCSNLEELILGKRVEDFYDMLSGCTNLKRLYSYNEKAPKVSSFADEVYENTALFIPNNSSESYGVNFTSRGAWGWSGFKHVYEIGSSDITDITDVFIDSVTNDDNVIYDLMGRRVTVNNLHPGIYIKDGKKILIH